MEQKQFKNSSEMEKRNRSVQLVEQFLKEVDQKPIALAKTFLTNYTE